MSTVHRIRPLTREQSIELLGRSPIGRVVFTDRALPAVLPVAYVLDGEAVIFRTAHGSRLARAAEGAVLAFEVDDIDPGRPDAWSVVVTGQSRLEEDEGECRRLRKALEAWVPGQKDVFVRIPLTEVTGREVTGRPLHV